MKREIIASEASLQADDEPQLNQQEYKVFKTAGNDDIEKGYNENVDDSDSMGQ